MSAIKEGAVQLLCLGLEADRTKSNWREKARNGPIPEIHIEVALSLKMDCISRKYVLYMFLVAGDVAARDLGLL